MDAQTANNLTNIAAVAVGGLIGGGATWLTTGRQIRHDDAARSAAAKRDREEAAARKCDLLLRQLKEASSRVSREEYDDVSMPLIEELEHEAVFLAAPLHARVEEGTLVLRHATNLSDFMYPMTTRWAAYSVYGDVHGAIAAWMRADPLPERRDTMADLIVGARLADEWVEEMIEMQDEVAGFTSQQTSWREHHQAEIQRAKAGLGATPVVPQ